MKQVKQFEINPIITDDTLWPTQGARYQWETTLSAAMKLQELQEGLLAITMHWARVSVNALQNCANTKQEAETKQEMSQANFVIIVTFTRNRIYSKGSVAMTWLREHAGLTQWKKNQNWQKNSKLMAFLEPNNMPDPLRRCKWILRTELRFHLCSNFDTIFKFSDAVFAKFSSQSRKNWKYGQ